MKLITYRQSDSRVRTGVVLNDRVLDISDWLENLPVSAQAEAHHLAAGTVAPVGGILRWLSAGPEADALLKAYVAKATHPNLAQAITDLPALAAVTLYAPVPRPGKIIGVGRNYADHAKETGVAPFEKPRIIFKMPSSVAAPGASVVRPNGVTKLDFESELAVVIGAFARDVDESDALSFVAGYTVLNDVSAREFQFDVSPAQTTFAKSMDSFCPMGPWLVTRDEVPDPQTLDVSCWLNGERMQHGHTADMLFPVKALVAYVSQFMTLEPGDILTTGTPAGIGAFRQPPLYLQPGDQLRLEVTGVGSMTHAIA
ncbi:MhpD 2-keto-4-pentenoate hydratase/2-oxohepta-3-ene-1,7-dioic acid hydratase (catechol pathway) [Burkholderiaceae bacterium]